MKHTALTPRRYHRLAREALFYSSNWISALLITYAVTLFCFGAVYLTDSLITVVSVFSPVPRWFSGLLYPVQYLLFSPLLVGLLHYYTELYRAAHGEASSSVPYAVIFGLYGTPKFAVRAWGQLLAVLLLCGLIPVSGIPVMIAFRLVLTNSAGILPAVLLTLFGITAFLSVLYLNARLTPFLYLTAARPELSFYDAVRRSWTTTADSALTGVLLQLGLLFASVLSVLFTAGILFCLYVLPIAIFTYVSYCFELSRRSELL